MTSVQTKKGGTGATDEDRKTILKQMKVRTKLKMDKSWIHQSSEDEKDKVTSPTSPQLKALEGRKLLWSPTPESEPDRNSGTFTAKETITSSSSSPVKSSNRNSGVFTAKEVVTSSPSPTVQSSNNTTETDTSSSSQSKLSPPPSTTGNKPQTSYIIRGQPVNAVSQVKSPTFFNGYQKSQVQARTTSLPRVPTATGYKMTKEEYKKLAPYNIRNKSPDLSDDETPDRTLEQVKRTEQASSVLRNTTSKDRSYVISAAKRHSGVGSPDSGTPFVAKRVEIKDEEIDSNRKSQTLPKTLTSYEDGNRYENNWKETQSKQSSNQPSPPRVTERSSSPRLTSYNMTSSADGRSAALQPEAGKITVVRGESKDLSKPSTEKESSSTTHTTRTESVPERSSSPRLTSYSMNSIASSRGSSVKPEVGKITVVREESRNDSKEVSKPPTDKGSSTTAYTTRTERAEVRDKMETGPKSLDSYLYEDASRFENSWKANQSVKPTSQTSPARVEARDKKDEAQPKSLDSYLYEDASRFENNWKANQPTLQTSPARVEVKKDETGPKSLDSYLYEDASRFENNWKTNQSKQPTLQTSPARASDRPENPTLTSWNTESWYSTIKPEPGKITVLRQESEKPKPPENRTSTRTVTTTVDSGNIDIPKLTSYSDVTETKSSNIQAGPGKITLLREESQREPPKVSSTTRTVETKVESNKDSPDIPKLTSSSISRTLTENSPIMQVGPGKITIIREDSTSPTPAPRSETKPKETISDKYSDLISWNDLDNNSENRLPKEKPAPAPTPVPRNTNKDSAKPAAEAPLIVISPEIDNKRPTQPSRSGTSSAEARHRVSESLDDPEQIPSSNQITSSPGNRNVKISIETLSEDPAEPPKIERISSSRIPSNSENRNVNISIETLSEDPAEPPKIERISSSRIPSNSENRNVKISIETLPEQPKTTETYKTARSSSPRPTPRSRESNMSTTVTESRYRVPEILEDTMLESRPNRSNSRTTVTTTRSTDPVYTEYLEDRDTRSTRTVSTSRETYTTTTTTETQYDDSSYGDASQYDPQSASNKGVLFVKEYVNSRESLKSPTTAGSLPDFSGDSEMLSYSNSSNYLYSSAPRRADEGPCTYCGREIKDCAKIMLDHLNIYCHEYCFKCGICNKPMGDLIDSIFIHRDVVHCESCYEKLF